MNVETGGVRHDYKELAKPPRGTASRRWLLFALGAALPLLTVALFLGGEAERPVPMEIDARLAAVAPQSAEPRVHEPEVAAVAAEAAPLEPTESSTEASSMEPGGAPTAVASAGVTAPALLDLLVERGDTLEKLFRRNDLSLADLAAIVALPDVGKLLKLLRPGDRLAIEHRDSEVVALRRELDEIKLLSVARGPSGFAATTIERPVDVRITGAHAMIDSSLFEAGTEAGMSDKLTMDMAGIFEWDIDFIQDVREGDSFTVIYEELWRDGVKLGNGDIVAAEFVNQGKAYRAARYRDATGRSDYFTPDGLSVRKAFIRAPLNFTRISSNFNPQRRHPVLNTIRAHRGVDYAAPTGTPVRAAGDGKVVFRGVQGGYGNVVILQHGGNVTTLYGHLSKFGKARVGSRVRQGEVIGYVGKSGLATGPHLHYEYRVNGVHRNPRTVPLPPADPVPARYREDFVNQSGRLFQQLSAYADGGAVTAAN